MLEWLILTSDGISDYELRLIPLLRRQIDSHETSNSRILNLPSLYSSLNVKRTLLIALGYLIGLKNYYSTHSLNSPAC